MLRSILAAISWLSAEMIGFMTTSSSEEEVDEDLNKREDGELGELSKFCAAGKEGDAGEGEEASSIDLIALINCKGGSTAFKLSLLPFKELLLLLSYDDDSLPLTSLGLRMNRFLIVSEVI